MRHQCLGVSAAIHRTMENHHLYSFGKSTINGHLFIANCQFEDISPSDWGAAAFVPLNQILTTVGALWDLAVRTQPNSPAHLQQGPVQHPGFVP